MAPYKKKFKESTLCKSYRKDTGQCVTGCSVKKIIKGNSCPYEDTEQENCPCFK